MIEIFLLSLVALSSVGAYFVGTNRLGLRAQSLLAAGARMLEVVGIALIFGAVNMSIGIVMVIATRTLTHWFLSLYMVNDISLWVLSSLQGLTFHWWRSYDSGVGSRVLEPALRRHRG